MESKIIEELKDYNFKDDWALVRAVWKDDVSLEAKEYVIGKYSERISQFDYTLTSYFFTSLSFELCVRCPEFIRNSIEAMEMEILTKFFYIDYEGRKLTGIANYLANEEWFYNDKKYEKIIIAYDLMKTNNYSDDKTVFDEDKLYNYGYFILGQLYEEECDVRVTNVILLNYIELIKKYYPSYFETFMKEGYKRINNFIYSNIMLTCNMMIFDCHVTAKLLDIKSFYYVGFNGEKDDCYGEFCEDKVILYIDLIKSIYENNSSKIAVQRLLHLLSHEIVHADQADYRYGIKQATDKLAKLRTYNCFISKYLCEIDNDFYLEYHDNFFSEYDANIRGLEILYKKYQMLPSLTDDDKSECSKIFANGLFCSYLDHFVSDIKITPVQFSKINLKPFVSDFSECISYDYKNFLKLLEYKSSRLKFGKCSIDVVKDNFKFSSEDLADVENNLTDFEKFMLGYDNPYLELLEMIANEEVYLPYNLLKAVPVFYEVNEQFIEKKYEFYKDNTKDKEKTKLLVLELDKTDK